MQKRQEIIANSKPIKKDDEKKVKNYEEESDEENNRYNLEDLNQIYQKYRARNTEDNYILRKNYSTKKQNLSQKKKYLVTEKSYILNSSLGTRAEITKKELAELKCLKKEKKKLDKKSETKDDHLMKYLKVELERAKKLQEVKKKLNEKDQQFQKFMKVKNKGMKNLENERYQDRQDISERQKIYEKLMSNYDEKVYVTKKKQLEQNKSSNLNKSDMEKSKNKMNELKEQIKDYEKKK